MVERLTREETRALVGPADDATLAAILELGVTRAELAEARAWIENDEALVNEGRRSPSGRVAREPSRSFASGTPMRRLSRRPAEPGTLTNKDGWLDAGFPAAP